MKRTSMLRRLGAVLAMAGMMFGQIAQAAGPQSAGAAAVHATRDVQLGEGGVLRGHVVDHQGAVQAQVKVQITKQGQVVAVAETNARGQFETRGLTGGVYQVETLKGGGVYRAWAPRTAPPAADQAALIVQGAEVVRGQDGRILSFLGNPWVLGGIVAAAIAIPLALDHDSGS